MAFNATATAIVVNSMEAALIQEAPMLGMFSIDSGIGISSPGQEVKVKFRAAPAAGARYDAVNNNYENGTDGDIDEAKVTLLEPWKLTKTIKPQHLRDGLELAGLAQDMITTLYRDLFIEAMTYVTAARYGASVWNGAATALTGDIMANLKAINAAALGWLPGRMYAAVESTYYANLLKDDDLKSWGAGAAEAQIATGELRPSVSGWKTYNAPMMPTQDNLRGIITDGTGIVMASAIDESAPGVDGLLFMNQIIKKPGLPVIQIVGHASAAKNQAFLTVKSLTTVGKGRDNGLKRLTSA